MEFQTVYVIWLREMKRVLRDRSQVLVGCIRPLIWLFSMGYGLSPSFQNGSGPGYRQFILPGIVMMAILFTSIQASISIIWDREFGFLKEMLVAPISRTSIVLGKTLGGTTIAVMEGAVVLLLAPFFHMPLSVLQIVTALGIMILVSFGLGAMGVVIASRMKSFEGFGAIINFLVMPLFLLSGALFPIKNLPSWLMVLVRINPLSYGVDLLRATILHTSRFSVLLDLSCLVAFTVVMLLLAIDQFNRQQS